MYQKHSAFKQPKNEDSKVWRYMDFSKLVSLIDSESLYFTRADKFEDPFEGSYPNKNVEAREIVNENLPPDVREELPVMSKNAGIDRYKD